MNKVRIIKHSNEIYMNRNDYVIYLYDIKDKLKYLNNSSLNLILEEMINTIKDNLN